MCCSFRRSQLRASDSLLESLSVPVLWSQHDYYSVCLKPNIDSGLIKAVMLLVPKSVFPSSASATKAYVLMAISKCDELDNINILAGRARLPRVCLNATDYAQPRWTTWSVVIREGHFAKLHLHSQSHQIAEDWRAREMWKVVFQL